MQYIDVKWLHSHPEETIHLVSEIGPDRYETRKIEFWSDGRVGYASQAGASAMDAASEDDPRGFFFEASDNAVFNSLVRSLPPEQRRLLGDMLLAQRSAAIHDVLAVLTDWMSSDGDGLAFTFGGEPMPVDLSGTGLHGDFIGRLQGWEWPNNGDPTNA
jgi:hypothetical protein